MNTKTKKFDSVMMMRKIRNSLSERYITKPDSENSDLKEIRKKYKIQITKKPTKDAA